MKPCYEKSIISAIELAQFMGISVRTLSRLDKSGILPASRRKSGRRYYTDRHIKMAIELMAAQLSKNTRVYFSGPMSAGSLYLPKKWLSEIGITPESPNVRLTFEGKSIRIDPCVPETD